MRAHMCVYTPICTCVRIDIQNETPTFKIRAICTILHDTQHKHTLPAHPRAAVHTRAHRRRRTGGGGGAQQVVRVAGADRMRVEVRLVGADVVAAARVGRVGLHERRPHKLPRSGQGGAARRLSLDPRGARRALVAAGGAGHVRACAPKDRPETPNRPYSGPPKCRVP